MKRILILNGSHSEIPLITASKEMGLFVITSGNDPTLLGHKYADLYCNTDFSDKDKILEISKKHNIDYICASANDFSIISASYVSENLGLPGHDSYATTKTLHQKDKFKKIAYQLNLKVPKSKPVIKEDSSQSIKDYFGFPFMVKPVDLTGGKGIYKVNHNKEIQSAINNAFHFSKEKRIIAEEFIDGTLHSFSTFLINKKVKFYFSDNEFCPIDPYHVTASFSPSQNINIVKRELINQIEVLAEFLNLVDGIFHLQYIYKNNKFHIIDITRRCSGDFYPIPVKYSSNLDLAKWIVKSEMGLSCKNFPDFSQEGFYGRLCVVNNNNGILKNVVIKEKLMEYVIEIYRLKSKGDFIKKHQKLMVLIFKFKSEDDIEILSRIDTLITIEIE